MPVMRSCAHSRGLKGVIGHRLRSESPETPLEAVVVARFGFQRVCHGPCPRRHSEDGAAESDSLVACRAARCQPSAQPGRPAARRLPAARRRPPTRTPAAPQGG